MAVFAKPSDRIVKVEAKDSHDFIKRFNQHVITKEQTELCKTAGRLFMHEGKKQT